MLEVKYVFYNIILTLLVLYVMSTPIIFMQAMKFGVKLIEKPEETAKEPVFTLPKKKPQYKMTDQEKRQVDILANMDRYVGDSRGQKKIEKR